MKGSTPLGFSGAEEEACPCSPLGCILRAVSQSPFPLWRAKLEQNKVLKKTERK